MVMPEQGQLLAQRVAALKHAVQPPAAQLLATVVGLGGDAADIGHGLGDLVGLRPSSQQELERALGTQALGLAQVVAAGAKGSAAKQVGGPFGSPRIAGRRLPRLPRAGGVDLIQRRHVRGHIPPRMHSHRRRVWQARGRDGIFAHLRTVTA